MNTKLKQKVAKGTFWNLVASGFELIASLGVTFFLMQMLNPSDFGLVAVASAFVALLQVIGSCGLSTALIQQPDHELLPGSALLANLMMTLIMGVIMTLLALPVSIFYSEPKLINIMLCLTLGSIMAGLSIVPKALIEREMLFHKTAIGSIIITSVSSIVAITTASYGMGYWALVFYPVSKSMTGIFYFWIVTRKKDIFTGYSWTHVKNLLSFGSKVAISNFVSSMGPSGLRLIIGRMLGMDTLGIYAIAWRLIVFPIQAVVAPLSGAAFPALCKRQADKMAVVRGYTKMVAVQLVSLVPVVVFLASAAFYILPLFNNPAWNNILPPIYALGIFDIVSLSFGSSYLVFLAVGKAEDRIWYLLANTCAFLLCATIGTHWGLTGAIYGVVTGWLITLPLQFRMLHKAISMKVLTFFRATGTVFFSCAALTVAMFFFRKILLTYNIPGIVAIIFLGVGEFFLYWLIARLLLHNLLEEILSVVANGRIRNIMSACLLSKKK